jgi:hypothetical protein
MRAENVRLKEELSRMQVMVMHYAQVVLDQRLRISSITSVEKQQIPSNIHSLRKAIGAAQIAGTVLDSSADYDNHGDLHDTPLPPQTSNGSSMRASQSVQSELARLRMQTEQLSGQCRAQHEELIAARRLVADANGQVRATLAMLDASQVEVPFVILRSLTQQDRCNTICRQRPLTNRCLMFVISNSWS